MESIPEVKWQICLFLDTAHPAKFKNTIDAALDKNIETPQKLADFMSNKREFVPISADFDELKKYILSC